jgi:hypothetical protein
MEPFLSSGLKVNMNDRIIGVCFGRDPDKGNEAFEEDFCSWELGIGFAG